MGWISKLLNKADQSKEPSHSTGFLDIDFEPVPINLTYSDPRAARALLTNAATQIVQIYGLPHNWLSFEVVTLADDEKAFFQLQVLVNHWDEYLMAHTHAFERAMMKRILTDDKKVGMALRAVLWRVAPIAGCPYDEMPEPDAWSEQAAQQRATVRDSVNRQLYMMHHKALQRATVADSSMPVDLEGANHARVNAKTRTERDSAGYDSTLSINLDDFASTLAVTEQEASQTAAAPRRGR